MHMTTATRSTSLSIRAGLLILPCLAALCALSAAPAAAPKRKASPVEEAARKHLADAAAAVMTAEKWNARAEQIRRAILRATQLPPHDARRPPRCIRHSLRAHDGYTVENLALETLPGFWATCCLYRPAGRGGPFPAVLNCHGHAREGRFNEHVQKRCATLARMGAAVLSINMVGFGDCDQLPHKVPFALALQLWDNMRALDFLAGMDGADPNRIAVTGSSGGGSQTFLLAAVDGRVAVSVPVAMVSGHFPGGCICENGLPVRKLQGGEEVNNAEIAACAAPRPQLVVSCSADWTKNTPDVELPFLRHVYALLGAADRVEGFHDTKEGHGYQYTKRVPVYRFLARHLKLDLSAITAPDGTIDEGKSLVESEAQMRVFDAAHRRPAGALKGADAVAKALAAPVVTP